MSKIGYIYSSYGTQFNVAIANTYSYNVLNGSNLPNNTIIISSNINEKFKDTGSYSLLMTDNDGNPVRLSYTIKEGNGITTKNNNNDIIYLNIDNKTIKDYSNGLKINISSFSNDIINTENNKFSINTYNLNYSDKNNRGIASVSNSSIEIDNDNIYVNTDNLDLSNNSTNSYGIVISGDNIININNGIISLNENNLPKTSEDNYGISKGDEYTLSIVDNDIIINTENLDYANTNQFGILSNDGNKIISNGGKLSIDSNSLQKADSSNYGLLRIDGNTIQADSNGMITIPEYNNFMFNLSQLNIDIDNELNSLESIKNEILTQIK